MKSILKSIFMLFLLHKFCIYSRGWRIVKIRSEDENNKIFKNLLYEHETANRLAEDSAEQSCGPDLIFLRFSRCFLSFYRTHLGTHVHALERRPPS